MKLESLSLHGLLRFADTVSIDFRELPAGLIALVGPNGSGKTTLMESALASLYRSFPSREKELFDYAQDRDSYLEASFTLDGDGTYRARVNVDGVKRLSEAVLELTAPDGTKTILNDGKVSTFDQAVARVFPSREVLLASAFSAQNRAGSFVSLDRKGRKQLFARLLGLDHYEQMAQTARTAGGLIETARGKLLTVRGIFSAETGPDRDAELATLAAELLMARGNYGRDRDTLAREIADLEAMLATVADQVAAYAVATQRVQTAEREQASTEAQRRQTADLRTGVDTALKAEILRLESARDRGLVESDERRAKSGRTLVDELAAIDAKLTATLSDLDTRIDNNRDLLARADEIHAAVARLAEIGTVLADERRTQQNLRDQIAALDLRDRDELVPALAKAQRAAQDFELARTNAALLATVPCGGEGTFSACKFLTNAKAAQDRMPTLAVLADELPAAELARKRLAEERAAAKGQAEDCGRRVVALETEQAGLAKTAKLEPSIAAAEARIAELTTARAEAETTALNARADADGRAAERNTEILNARATLEATTIQSVTEAKERAEDQAVTLDGQIESIAETLAGLATRLQEARAALDVAATGNQQAAHLQASLGILRGRWDATTADLGRLDGAERDMERRRQDLASRRAELADLDRRVRLLDVELLDWQLLATALGRDGLPVLEIDAAGPTVTAFANDLLASCFGPRFSLELVTQEAKASGKGVKEAFEIKVFDNARGGAARDIGDLSGGEQIIVSEALANAIALTANARSDRPIRTCWRDETTGPLDAENAARYVPMLRKLRELGGFNQIIFVSHNPEAAALADAQLRFDDGAVTVALPPYAA